MSEPQLAENPSQSHSLSDEASNLLCRIPQLLHCLRELEEEEATLNTQARQLLEPQLSTTKDKAPTSIFSTPVSKLRIQGVVDRASTLHVDPGIYHFTTYSTGY